MTKAVITGKTKEKESEHIFEMLHHTLKNIGVDYININPEDPIPVDLKFDIIFCIGGDGNFIGAARKFVNFDKPVIGINSGNLCFLPNICPEEIPVKVPYLIQKKTHDWTKRLAIVGRNKDLQLCALNEFLFSNTKKGVLSQFTLYINNYKSMSVRADGLLLATPTGSTAYNLSAGGAIALPDMEILLITPVCPHILGERPLVVGLNNEIKIVNSSNKECNVWADGQVSIPFNPNDEFVIQKPKYIKTHPQTTKDFFETLALKLGWNPQNIIEK
ncbi:MAG: NAD(+)/NADH kinase [Brevinema sp.]